MNAPTCPRAAKTGAGDAGDGEAAQSAGKAGSGEAATGISSTSKAVTSTEASKQEYDVAHEQQSSQSVGQLPGEGQAGSTSSTTIGVLIFMVIGGVLFTGYRFYKRRANAGPQPHHHVQRPPGASPGRYEMSPFSKGFDEDDEDGFV